MSKTEFNIAGLLVKQLEHWTEQLVRISLEDDRCRCELADIGVIVKKTKPSVEQHDRPAVIRLKQKLLFLYQKRISIYDEMADAGAELLDEQTMEVVLADGPESGTYLSWLPGEPCIAWWREKKERSSPRHLIPGIEAERAKTVIH